MLDETFTEELETDNSTALETDEPEVSDNSEKDQEPETNTEENKDEQDLIGGKFKSQEELLKAYQEQEKQVGSMSNEVGELRKVKEEYDKMLQQKEELAQAYGFNSAAELEEYSQQLKVDNDIASFTADEYLKNIGECEFPDEMRNLLLSYKQNPSPDLLDTIEAEFSNATIKNVAKNVAFYQGQLANQRQQALDDKMLADAEEYLKDVTTKYNDDRYFKDAAFRDIFSDLFKVYGPNLQADYVIDRLEKYAQSRISQFQKGKARQDENANSTDAIEGLNDSFDNQGSSKSVLDMTPEELSKALRTTYKR